MIDILIRSIEEQEVAWQVAARNADEKVRADGGGKTLIVIVDDSEVKQKRYFSGIKRALEFEDFGAVISTHSNGEDVIGFMRAFYRLNPDAHKVVLMDGQLDSSSLQTKYKTGILAFEGIKQLTDMNAWSVPYLVGISQETHLNEFLTARFKDQVLSTAASDDAFSIVEAIRDSRPQV